MLRATSSLSVFYRVTAIVLIRASFHNLRKVFSISRSTCTSFWLVDRVTNINCQENSNKQTNKQNQPQERFKVVKINENPTLKNKNCLKTLENSGIWSREGGASG